MRGKKPTKFLEKQEMKKKKDEFLLTLEKTANCITLLTALALLVQTWFSFTLLLLLCQFLLLHLSEESTFFSFESLFAWLAEWSSSCIFFSHGAVEVTSKEVYCRGGIFIRNGTKKCLRVGIVCYCILLWIKFSSLCYHH